MGFWDKEVAGMALKDFALNSLIAVIFLAVGIFIGRVADYFMKKALSKAKIEKTNAYNFFKVLILAVKWGIYILFVNLAIRALSIPRFTTWITDILVIFPAIIGALILILIGFIIAIYIKKVVEDSRVEKFEVLSELFFVFIIYIFLVFAFKTALISMDQKTVNILLIILSGIIGIGIAVRYVLGSVKQKKR